MDVLYKVVIVSLVLVILLPCMQVRSVNIMEYTPTTNNDEALSHMAEKVAGAVSVVGTVVSLATLIYIGIKFMTGSVDEKAGYKQTLLPWFIGAIMVFVITLVPSLIFNIANTFNN